MITIHTELIQALIDKHNLKSYLEIGINNPDNNFNKIKCENKYGVDPDIGGLNFYKGTSDRYFEIIKPYPERKFDIIFIDGLHHADQVKRDFENSLRCLNDNGFIILHDVLPTDEITTCVPRGTQKIWHGDVYKFALNIGQYKNINYKTFNIDNGCMLVWKEPGRKNDYKKNLSITYDWDLYKTLGRTLINVTDEITI